jgi:hypothetical protein
MNRCWVCVANLASVKEYIKMGVLASQLKSLDHSTSRKAANCATRQEICHILWNPKVLCYVHISPTLVIAIHMTPINALPSYFFKIPWPPLWSSGQSFWLQIQRSRVRSPALPDFLSSSGSGTGSTQPREVNWGATWMKKVAAPGLENRD